MKGRVERMKKLIKPYIDENEEKSFNEFLSRCDHLGNMKPKKTIRRCKNCKKELDAARYYECATCKPDLWVDLAEDTCGLNYKSGRSGGRHA